MSKLDILKYRKKHRPTCSYSVRLLNRLKEFEKQHKNRKLLRGEVSNYKPLNFDLIKKAICFAKKNHDGQFRKSGKPFYTQPLEVAYIVSDYSLKTDVIVTSILYDIVEDTQVTVGMIVDEFSWRIAEMVNKLTHNRSERAKLSVEKILDNAYDEDDKEVLLIKVIDRLHNMQTIGAKQPESPKNKTFHAIKRFVIPSIFLKKRDIESQIYRICKDMHSHLHTPLKLFMQKHKVKGSVLEK